ATNATGIFSPITRRNAPALRRPAGRARDRARVPLQPPRFLRGFATTPRRRPRARPPPPRSPRAAAPTRAGRSRASAARRAPKARGCWAGRRASRRCGSSSSPSRCAVVCTPSSAVRSASSTRRAARGTAGRRAPPRVLPASGASRWQAQAAQARGRQQQRVELSRAEGEGLADPLVELLPAGGADDVRRHDAAATVDEERLRVAGDAVVPGQREVVGHDRIRDPEAAHELERRAPQILLVDAEEDDVLAGPALRSLGERPGLARARRAVRLPEVEHDDLAAQRCEAELAARVDTVARERRRGDDLALVDLARDLAAALVRDVPDEYSEQRQHDGNCGALCGSSGHQTMKTVVPMSTWLNSHSACGISIRMQPCDSL